MTKLSEKILVIALLIIMGVALVLLTGCGGDKIVATKTTEDSLMGNYEEQVVVTFKDDVVENVEMSMEFDSKETAEGMYGLYNMGVSMSEDESLSGLNVKLDGKKLVITMDASAYASQGEMSKEDMSKDAIRKSLEESGYKIK